MRCNTCGTQNEPDSRFCGGCGARLMSTLAPTQKVVPDPVVQAAVPKPRPAYANPSLPPQQASLPSPAAMPAPQRGPSGPQTVQRRPSTPPNPQQPVARPSGQSMAPATVQRPPQSSQRSAAAPRSGSKQPVAPAARSARASADRSLAVPGRRWGLILVVLLLDLGLAGAGIYLLMEGLASGEVSSTRSGAAAPTSAPAPVASQAAPAKPAETKPAGAKPAEPAPPPTTTSATEVQPVSAPVDTGSAAAPADPPPPAVTTQGRRKLVGTPKKSKPVEQPIDPYQESSGPSLGPPPPPAPNATGL